METKEFNEKTSQRKLLIWITIVFAVALLLIALSLYLVLIYPENQTSQLGITNVTEKTNFISQTRTTLISFITLLAQIFGGVAVGIGIYFAWGNLKVAQSTLESNQKNAEKNLEVAIANLNSNQETAKRSLEVALANLKSDQETAQKNIEISLATLDSNIKNAQKSLEIAQEGQITERFTRAIDQLGAVDKDGNPAIEIRLGGIYALERIANESEKDYWPIIEILTAYVRKNSSIEIGDNNKVTHISMDIQANESTKSEFPEARKISLDTQAILAVIGKPRSHFKNEESNRINLRGTCLEGAYLTKAHFEDADLSYVHFEMANLIDAHFDRANFMEAHLELARLDRAKLQEITLVGAYLSGACLDGANLKKAYLHGAYLDADFVEAHLEGAYLYMSHLEDADLSGAYLMGANLEKAILIRANMEGSDLSGANFTKANLEEAILIGAKNLTVDQLSKAETLYEAKLDPELEEELRVNNYSYLLDEPKLDPELEKELREKFPVLFEERKDEP